MAIGKAITVWCVYRVATRSEPNDLHDEFLAAFLYPHWADDYVRQNWFNTPVKILRKTGVFIVTEADARDPVPALKLD